MNKPPAMNRSATFRTASRVDQPSDFNGAAASLTEVGHRMIHRVALLCIACTAILSALGQLPGGTVMRYISQAPAASPRPLPRSQDRLPTDQDVLGTAGGAAICSWPEAGRIKLWLGSHKGCSANLALLPTEVEALIGLLQLGKEAA
jgi:hypothetical protein